MEQKFLCIEVGLLGKGCQGLALRSEGALCNGHWEKDVIVSNQCKQALSKSRLYACVRNKDLLVTCIKV